MNNERAARFAEGLMRAYAHKVEFEVSLHDHDSLIVVAKVLEERFNCEVDWQLNRNRICVRKKSNA
jgi:hypothetical protein